MVSLDGVVKLCTLDAGQVPCSVARPQSKVVLLRRLVLLPQLNNHIQSAFQQDFCLELIVLMCRRDFFKIDSGWYASPVCL